MRKEKHSSVPVSEIESYIKHERVWAIDKLRKSTGVMMASYYRGILFELDNAKRMLIDNHGKRVTNADIQTKQPLA